MAVAMVLGLVGCSGTGTGTGSDPDPSAVTITATSCSLDSSVQGATSRAHFEGTASGPVGASVHPGVTNGGSTGDTALECGGWTAKGDAHQNANNVWCLRETGQPASIAWKVTQPVLAGAGYDVMHLYARLQTGSSQLNATKDLSCPY